MSDPFDLSGFEDAGGAPPAPAGAPAYPRALNEEQGAAVEALDGPVLVLARAGTEIRRAHV